VQLKLIINSYEGNFAAMDKSLPIKGMLRLADLTLRDSVHLLSQSASRISKQMDRTAETEI